jgi:dTDP-4-amino-4,6-dideoxygalactose transaminase
MRGAITRRGFLAATTAGAAAGRARALVAAPAASGNGAPTVLAGGAAKPALLGGPPVRRAAFASWPVVDEREETALREVLRGGRWYRGDGTTVARFEEAYARLTGARHCIATANGTSALYASLAALDVSPGDEVVLPPYTFVATLNVVFLQYALPVFVDSDPETFQVDARRLEGALTERTAAIVPVHLGGNVCDLDAILEVSRRRRVPVVEDACQAPLAEWRGRKAGTLGDTGCFSFQASKNLNCGEGGAILTSDDDLAARCWAFHDNARGRRGAGYGAAPPGGRGANLRLTEFQAGLLLAQMTRLEGQSRRREENARHLTRRLGAIPGILPARMHEGCTRNAARLSCLPAALPAGDARRLGRAQPLPGQRPPVRGGGLADPDDAARPAAGHGRHRRRDREGPGLGRGARRLVRPKEDRMMVRVRRSRAGPVGQGPRPAGPRRGRAAGQARASWRGPDRGRLLRRRDGLRCAGSRGASAGSRDRPGDRARPVRPGRRAPLYWRTVSATGSSSHERACREAVERALAGDWEAAHVLVQEPSETDATAAWIHAVVHRMEGDLGNARYWYRRCGRTLRENVSTEAELREIRARLTSGARA